MRLRILALIFASLALASFKLAHRVQWDLMAMAHAQAPNLVPPPGPNGMLSSPALGPGAKDQSPDVNLEVGEFVYDPTGRRDPFRPYYMKDSVAIPLTSNNQQEQDSVLVFLKDSKANQEPLQAYDLNNFQILAIMWDALDPKAVVKAPNGKTYTLRKLTRIGKNNGYVATIREGEIVVIEVTSDGKTPSTRVLTLQK
jgi:type IV pilus assembly protein PilP